MPKHILLHYEKTLALLLATSFTIVATALYAQTQPVKAKKKKRHSVAYSTHQSKPADSVAVKKDSTNAAIIGNSKIDTATKPHTINHHYHHIPSANTALFDSCVKVKSYTYNGTEFHFAFISRSGDHAKAKYFASTQNGLSVPKRFAQWRTGKNMVAYLCPNYLAAPGISEGLTIDDGRIVNNSLINNRMDGLLIVYATGGIVAVNLKDCDLTIDGNNGRKYDLRKSAIDLADFMSWAMKNNATVFQTHLLVYKNKLLVSDTNSSPGTMPRRLLVVGHDTLGNIVHIIVNSADQATLYKAAASVYNIIAEQKLLKDIAFMINCDSGIGDVARVFHQNKSLDSDFEGRAGVENAYSLLAYYWE